MKRLFFALLIIFAIGVLGTSSVFAKEKDPQKNVVVAAETVIDHDYFASGDDVAIFGTVNGDVYVFGENIVVDGQINGDLIALGGTVEISGDIAGDARVGAGKLVVGGNILGSMTAGAGQIDIDDGSTIGHSVVLGAGSLRVDGSIERGAVIGANEVILNSYIGQDVKISAEALTLSENAKINGDLNYWSKNDATVRNSDSVFGSTTKHTTGGGESQKDAGRMFEGVGIFWKITSFLSAFILGFVLLKFVPVFMLDVVKTYKSRPLASFGLGLLALVLAPILFILLLLSVVGIPFAVFVIFGTLIILMVSKIFVAMFAGEYLKEKLKLKVSALGVLAIGLIAWGVVTSLPVIGGILSFVGCVSAVGALFVTKKSYYKMLSAKKLI